MSARISVGILSIFLSLFAAVVFCWVFVGEGRVGEKKKRGRVPVHVLETTEREKTPLVYFV
jgi:hypothetical protein